MSSNVILVDNHYPIDYFANNPLVTQPQGSTSFWASNEVLPPAQEYLLFDFGSIRPLNFIGFEIIRKPIDILIQYSTDKVTWTNVSYLSTFTPVTSTTYIPSTGAQWEYIENHFTLVQAQYIKITFTRRTDPFPFTNSDLFPWSIEVRNLRNIYLITQNTDFVSDVGTDLLGNTFNTALKSYPVANILNTVDELFWKSQFNTNQNAVEALYFDLRNTSQPGTMGFLDEDTVLQLDALNQGGIELTLINGVVIDEIYIDPLTYGPYVHIYYTLDDNSDWDEKIWIPINQHYVLKKGFFSLPYPILVKYIKLEFSNLTAIPYHVPEYPSLPPMTYKTYPVWVQNYFANQLLGVNTNNTNTVGPTEQVIIDPIELGFTIQKDTLNSGLDIKPPPTLVVPEDEIQNIITNLIQAQKANITPPTALQSQITFNSPYVWSSDLSQILDTTRALGRLAQQGDSPWNSENQVVSSPAPIAQNIPQLIPARLEKQTPIMYFPYPAAHDYLVQEEVRTGKIAYYVGIKGVSFHRRDYDSNFTEQYYTETFADSTNFGTVNDFIQDESIYVITP